MSTLKHSAQEYLLRGNNKVLLGDYKAAIYEFTKAIIVDPNFPPPYTCRGAAKLELRDYQGAIDDCQHAIRLHFQGEIDKENSYDPINNHGKKLNPVYGRLYSIIGIAKLLMGKTNDGILDLNSARLLGNNDAIDIMKTYGRY